MDFYGVRTPLLIAVAHALLGQPGMPGQPMMQPGMGMSGPFAEFYLLLFEFGCHYHLRFFVRPTWHADARSADADGPARYSQTRRRA